MTFVKYFLFVFAAALLSSAAGGLFAAIIGFISPEFVKGLFTTQAEASVVRYAIAMGMIWGLFMGAAVMGFCLALVTLVQIVKIIVNRGKATA